GDFLAGFSLRDSTSFDDWQYFQAERLRRELASTLERLGTAQIGQHPWGDAAGAAPPLPAPPPPPQAGPPPATLPPAPPPEPAPRQLMRIYAWSGRRGAALRQFQACQRVLADELGVEPLEETVAVHEAIQANRLPPPPAVATPPPGTGAAGAGAAGAVGAVDNRQPGPGRSATLPEGAP